VRAGRTGDRLTAVFLDRDGVINRKPPEGDYVTSWAQFEFLPGALEAIRELTEAALTLVIATNQRGIARGRMTDADLSGIHERMLAEIEAAGGRIAAVYRCPHEVGECDCRKPHTGMFERAAREVPGVTLASSAVIGDSASDMEAARKIGALAVFVGAGAATDVDHAAASLREAARWLLRAPVA
jgi:D-glycero-D-manno-heptose 1,7-bisphosphate phosphatase